MVPSVLLLCLPGNIRRWRPGRQGHAPLQIGGQPTPPMRTAPGARMSKQRNNSNIIAFGGLSSGALPV